MIGSKRALVSSISAAATILYCDLTQGVLPPWLSHSYSTTTGVNPPNYFDVGGNLQYVPNNQIPNTSTSPGATSVSSSDLTNLPIPSAPLWKATTAAGGTQNMGVYGPYTGAAGQIFIASCWIYVPSSFNGTQSRLDIDSTTVTILDSTYRLADLSKRNQWQKIWIKNQIQTGTTIYFVYRAQSVAGGDTLYWQAPQLELVTAAQTTPNPYMPTSGTPYFGSVVNDYNPATLAALGLRNDPLRTNSIRNSAMLGSVVGTPGTLPTNMYIGTVAGVTTSVVGSGSVGGLPYVDVNWAGTSTASGTLTLQFESGSAVVAASGQTWASSVFAAVTGGSQANVASPYLAIGENNSGGSFLVGSTSPITLTSTLTRLQMTRTLNNAATAYVMASISGSVANGVAVNMTLRIALTQLEQNAFATSSILTYGTAVTVPADNWSFTGAALAQLVSGRACIAIEALAEGVVTNQGWFSIGHGPNYITAFMNTATSDYFSGVTSGISWLNYGPVVGGNITTAKRCIAMSWNGNSQAFSYDGASPVTATVNNPTGMTSASLGNGGGGASYCWFSKITIRPPVSANQVQKLSTTGSNMRAN